MHANPIRAVTEKRRSMYCTGSPGSFIPAASDTCSGVSLHFYFFLTLFVHLFPDLTISKSDILCCCQRLQTHRTSGMKFLCTDADLRSEAEFKSIGKS